MTKEQLQKGKELSEIIRITEEAYSNLLELKNKQKKDNSNYYYDDGHFWLSISEHKDGSGTNAILTRYLGNEELLNGILQILKNQIARFKKEFEEL